MFNLKGRAKLGLSLIVSFWMVFAIGQDNHSKWFPGTGASQINRKHTIIRFGGLVRGDTTKKNIHLFFTGGDYHDGGNFIRGILKKKKVRAHFFFTGDFYRLKENKRLIKRLRRDGHYLGPHSDKHLLYADWTDRDSLLVNKNEFVEDLKNNYHAMATYGIHPKNASLFMPPYEWYNATISQWATELGITLINFTPGTRSNADYTTPDMGEKYLDSNTIYMNILNYEESYQKGLNGFILLIHIGTHPDRTDKLYYRLDSLITEIEKRGYTFTLLNTPH